MIIKAVTTVVKEEKIITYDLGGKSSTLEMANEILRVLKSE